MQVQGRRTPYEVYCPRCNVTFPTGSRSCVHCGGRLSRERWQSPEEPLLFGESGSPPEDQGPRFSPFSPVAVLWVLLFVGGTLYRACTSG